MKSRARTRSQRFVVYCRSGMFWQPKKPCSNTKPAILGYFYLPDPSGSFRILPDELVGGFMHFNVHMFIAMIWSPLTTWFWDGFLNPLTTKWILLLRLHFVVANYSRLRTLNPQVFVAWNHLNLLETWCRSPTCLRAAQGSLARRSGWHLAGLDDIDSTLVMTTALPTRSHGPEMGGDDFPFTQIGLKNSIWFLVMMMMMRGELGG